MFSFGLQSALAIRRQRLQAELKRAVERRRSSTQSYESTGNRGSRSTVASYLGPTRIIMNNAQRRRRSSNTEVNYTISVLDVGIIFALVGVALMVAGILLNGHASLEEPIHWNYQVFMSGIGFFAIGFLLIIIGQLCNRRDADELASYVDRQMSSGNNWKTNVVADLENGTVHTELHQIDRQPGEQPPQRNTRKPSLSKITEEDLIQLHDMVPGQSIANVQPHRPTKLFWTTRCYEETEV